jgi:cytochrome P450
VLAADRNPVIVFDHHSADFAKDPDARWRELREQCPIAWTESYGGHWVVSDFEGNHEVLKQHDIFTTERLPGMEGGSTLVIPTYPTDYLGLPEELDPPAHTPLRRMLNEVSSPAAAEAMMDRIKYWTALHLDAVVEAGQCDLVYAFASPVPAYITLEWLGFPLEHATLASECYHDGLGFPPGHERFNASIDKRQKVEQILEETVEARRAEPRNDTISYFTQYRIDDEPVPNRSIVEMCLTLVGGGVDSTTSLTTSALVHLHHDRQLRQRFIDEPDLLVPATEEFLRFYAPFGSIARTVRNDTVLRGCPMKAGDRVLVARHSGNHDAKAFPNPDEFVPDRFPNRHVSFGLGVHRCSGSHVARLMFREMISQVLARIPDYELDETAMDRYPDRGFVQGWVNLPARYTPGRRSAAR